MERPVRAQFNTQIYEEACEWFVECRAGDLDDVARAQFNRWLRKSPEHQSAYLEIAAIWNEGPTLDPDSRWAFDTLIAQAVEDSGNVVALERTAQQAEALQSPREKRGSVLRRVRDRRPFFAVAASLLVVMATLVAYLITPSGVYATTLGEQRSLALNDGSTVQLNSLSRIRIRYSQYERTVYLVEGQALFHVAKDSARPFMVYSGQTRVKAVGTEFDVYRKADGTVVTVVEGRVAVLPASSLSSGEGARKGALKPAVSDDQPNTGSGTAAPEGAVLVAAGEQVTVTSRAAHKTPHPNVTGATAWTERRLVFDSVPLADVANEFNRYNERKLVIEPSALGGFRISGVFSSTDPASLIRFLRDRPGLRVIETSAEIKVERDL